MDFIARAAFLGGNIVETLSEKHKEQETIFGKAVTAGRLSMFATQEYLDKKGPPEELSVLLETCSKIGVDLQNTKQRRRQRT